MTGPEAGALTAALNEIERGRVEWGVTLLRAVLREAGYPAEPFVISTRAPQQEDDHGSDRHPR